MTGDVVEPLAREVGRMGMLLHGLQAKHWALPTRCPPLSVLELTAHVLRGATRILDMAAAKPVNAEPEKDAVTYFQYDAGDEGPLIVQRAQEGAAGKTGAQLLKDWDLQWIKALRDARGTSPESVRPAVFGLMRFDEYLKTRVVEVTIHHMDVRDALGRGPDPDPAALEIVGDVLRGLLGTDLRRAGMDDVRFALVGTGRAALADNELDYLGPLAQKFPLFA